MLLDLVLVPFVVLLATGDEQYLFSAMFGAVFTCITDPGGSFGGRAWRNAVFALLGGAITALGFGLATSGWGWLVVAASVLTLLAGLVVTFGLRRFAVAMILNIWFFIALAVGIGQQGGHLASHAWAQAVAFGGGSVLWIALTFVAWVIQGRSDRPQPIAELPGDTSARPLTRQLIAFAVLRALAMAAATALAFGAGLSHADWLPIATIVALKPSLDQTTLVGLQRLIGALIGAIASALLLLIAANDHGLELIAVRHALEIIVIVILMHGVAIRTWNYALYTAAIAAGALLAVDLPHPSNYSAEGERVLWTLVGVAIATLVMLLGNLLAKRSAQTPPSGAPSQENATGSA
jgi:hypothetical protein